MNNGTKITANSIRNACERTLSENSLANGFTLVTKRVCMLKSTKEGRVPIPICDPFEVVGRTYDELGENYGLVIRFIADGSTKSVVETSIGSSDLVGDPKKVVASLANKGLWVSAARDHVARVGELLSMIRPEREIVTVGRAGWHGELFVAPTGEVLGNTKTEHRLHENAMYADPANRGDLAGWKVAVNAALNSANGDFLGVGLFSGFTGVLVQLLNEETSPILNFAGTTSRGKTTSQRFGASVWGNPIRDAALVKFNTTVNAIEAIAQRANGTLLALDEGGQSGSKGLEYQREIFTLAEGSGKHRLTQNAAERKVRRWSTCITISEEIGFADKVKREGRNAAAGAVARCWEIDVDDAAELDYDTLEALDGIKKHYGHAGPIFVQFLIDQGFAEDVDSLARRVKAASALLTTKHDAPQMRRVAGAAALVLVAGELAQEAGLVSEKFDVSAAVRRVLQRSFRRMASDMDPLETALTNLREGVVRRLGVDVVGIDYDQEHQYREVLAYYGYPEGPARFSSSETERPKQERVYFIPAEQMAVLGGGNVTAANMAKGLKKVGQLIEAPGNNNLWPRLPEIGKIKHYRVHGTFFHEDEPAVAAVAAE